LTKIIPKPVTRSKCGHRRKPRRITPFVVDNYWPGGQRVAALKRHWGSYKPWWEIVERINRFPAPKSVNRWQCWLMASHLGIRRPVDISSFTRINAALGPDIMAIRVRNRGPSPPLLYMYEPVQPESALKLRKVGRKPKPPKPPKRKTPLPTATEGMKAVGSRSWRRVVAQNRLRGKRRRGKGRKARRAVPSAT
jgi:hypothetical protein